jgi:hypothetical protein
MRSLLQLLFAANIALLIWCDVVLGFLVRRRVGSVPIHRRLIFPLSLAHHPRASASITGVPAHALDRIWDLSQLARRWMAVLFVALFIVVYAQARWPFYWWLVKHQLSLQ